MKKNNQYVGVDEKYIPDDEKYIDDKNNEKTKKIIKGIGIGYLAIILFIFLIAIAVFVFIFMNFIKISDRVNERQNNVFNVIGQ